MKKNSGLILILIVVLLVGLFYSPDNSGSNNPSIGDGTTDIIVPPSEDDGSTDIIIPPGGDEPTEEVPTEEELLEANIEVPDDSVTIGYYDGMTWLDYFNSELYENCWTEFTINDGDDFIYNCDFDDREYMLVYYLDGDYLSVTVNDEIDSSFEYSLVSLSEVYISLEDDAYTVEYYAGMTWLDYFNSKLYVDGDTFYGEYVYLVYDEDDGETYIYVNESVVAYTAKDDENYFRVSAYDLINSEDEGWYALEDVTGTKYLTTEISINDGDTITVNYYVGMSWKEYFNSALNVFNGDDYDMVEFIDGDNSIYYCGCTLYVPTEDGEDRVSYNHLISSGRYYFYEEGDGA